ncbi:MAG: DcaP family trimeric outer membrane transporter [Stellaceae bacterium]
MTMTRRIGAVAALGGMMTAAAALLTGLPAAQADELSQLQANQALLQQRLTQLEQQAKLGAAPLAPGAPTLAGSFPRSILIPGTNTSLRVGGYVQLDGAYIFNGTGPNGNAGAVPPLTAGSPIAAGAALRKTGSGVLAAPTFGNGHNNGWFAFQANESRFFIETRTPTAYGEAITHIEMDFFGCAGAGGLDCSGPSTTTSGYVPRLRLAYGTLGPFLVGQDWGPTLDLSSSPTLFDFGGDVGILGPVRLPQVRYTAQLPYGMHAIIAAVEPQIGIFTPAGALASDSVGTGLAGTNASPTTLATNPTKTRWPDGALVLRIERPWGSFQIGSVLRDLTLQDGRFVNKDFLGYGGQVGVHMVPFPGSRDNFGLNAFLGNGLGHYSAPTGTTHNTFYGIATNYGGASTGFYGGTGCTTTTTICDSKANAAHVLATTFTSWGAEGNYQHWWKFAPGWRSTISAGIIHQDVPTTLLGPVNGETVNFNRQIITGHLNLMWSPVAFVNTGIEYSYGHRLTIWKESGSVNILDFAFRVTF